MSGTTASNVHQHTGFTEPRASNPRDAITEEDEEAIPSGPLGTVTSETKPNTPRRTPSRIRTFFRRSRSSTLEAMQNSFNSQSVQGLTCATPTVTAPLSPTPSCSQYIGHSAENSENSHSTISSSTYSNTSTTNSIAEPWHLSVTPKNYKRSSTGLSFTNSNVMFATPPKPHCSSGRERSPSINDTVIIEADNYISMPAATGASIKTRRFSGSFSADFDVETVELHDEYTSGSIVPGRRRKLVGKGSTATVKLMIQKGASTDGVFAVKEYRRKRQHETQDEYVKKVKSEYMIAKSLRHPNIVESVRLCTHSGRWNHVMEFCSQGEIYTLVQKNYLTLEDELCLFKQLLRGVAYLHSNGIAHRDIKLENLLMNNEGHLKIIDFGASAVFYRKHPGMRKAQINSEEDLNEDFNECRLCAPGICGSLPYIAPEVIDKSGHYDPRPLDIWSCAIVLLSMIYRGNPWPAANRSHPHHHYARFLSGWDKFIDKYSNGLITGSETPSCGPLFSNLQKPAIRHLLLRMMHPNPNKRITISEAVGDRSVKGIECCCLEEYGEDARIDAKDKESWRAVGRMGVRKIHNHLPPKEARLPGVILQRFDLGSR